MTALPVLASGLPAYAWEPPGGVWGCCLKPA